MSECCPECNTELLERQEICEICGKEIEWEKMYDLGYFNPLLEFIWTLKGKGLIKKLEKTIIRM